MCHGWIHHFSLGIHAQVDAREARHAEHLEGALRELGDRSLLILVELLRRPEVTATIIATDENFHFDPTMLAIEQGHDLFIEKPLATDARQSAEILAAIERHGVNLLFLPPTVIYMLLSSPRLADHDYASLRCLIYAGAPMSVDRLQQALAVFGPVLLQGYGQAEAPFFCTCLTPEDHLVGEDPERRKRLESCGRATLFTDVAVMDDEGRLLADGETGEIVVRGDIVMKGYYRNPAATAEVSRFGWHHTGDVGYRDAAGYFFIVDRKRDLIISGGFNISPAEIERVLWSHAAVQDCVVIGVPDETWGESVKAVVELKPGAHATEEELMALCAERLGRMKRPRSIEFWPELPRSPVGKVLKRDIRARYWAGRGRAV